MSFQHIEKKKSDYIINIVFAIIEVFLLIFLIDSIIENDLGHMLNYLVTCVFFVCLISLIKLIQFILRKKHRICVFVNMDGILIKNKQYDSQLLFYYYKPSFWNIYVSNLSLVAVYNKLDMIYPNKRETIGHFSFHEIRKMARFVNIKIISGE